MSTIGSTFSRVPTLLASQSALTSINRSNAAMLRLQHQIASGLRVSRPSDDPLKAATIAYLDDRLERADQRARNLNHGQSALDALDSVLGEISELALEAKSVAVSNLGTGIPVEQRRQQAGVISGLIDSLFHASNTRSVAGHVIGASTAQAVPVQSLFSGYRYAAQGPGLLTDLGDGLRIPLTLSDNPVIGTSARVRSDVQLQPQLSAATPLVEVRGARGVGVAVGAVQIEINGQTRLTVDLGGADTIGNVADAITHAIRQYEDQSQTTILGTGGVTVGEQAILIDVSADPVAPGGDPPVITFIDLGAGTTARDLGLTAEPFIGGDTPGEGEPLDPILTWRSPIGALLDQPLGKVRLRNAGHTRIVDLSGAQNIGDIRDRIHGAGLGVRIEINETRDGLNIVSEVSTSRRNAMSIEDADETGTASLLGIRTYAPTTRLADFNFGRGVRFNTDSVDPVTGLPDPQRDVDFTIHLGDGTRLDVDLRPQDMVSVATLIARINQIARDVGQDIPGDFEARIGPGGLMLAQDGDFPEPLRIEPRNGSQAAEDIGLLHGAYDAQEAAFFAEDRAKVRVNSLFSHLLDLRDALLDDDLDTLTLAGEDLESVIGRVAESRAQVGGWSRRIVQAATRHEDLMVLDESIRSTLRDTDFAEAAMRLSLLQTQLQAGLASAARLSSLSLLDYLR